MLRIDGSLFFGAVEHVRDELEAARAQRPELRHLLLVGSAINFVDASGADLLAHEARALRNNGVTLYLCKLKPQVHDVLKRGGQLDVIESLQQTVYYGKVYNLFVESADLQQNIVVTGGYLNGTAFYQNEGAASVNRKILRGDLVRGVFQK